MLKEAYITKYFHSEQPFPQGPYCLSMLITDASFMYAVSTADFKKVAELLHVKYSSSAQPGQQRDHIAFLVQNYFLLRKKFEKVNIAVLNHEFSLVPEAFATGSSIRSLLGFTSGNLATGNLVTHSVKGAKFSHAPDSDLSAYLEKTFVNASVRHAGAVNINLLFSQHSLVETNVFLNVNDACIELVIKDKSELLFYNVFNYQSDEDILYYLLFTMEQFDLNPLLVRLSVGGQVAATDTLMKSLRKYIKFVSFCVNDPAVEMTGDLGQLPQHYYFTLLNQHTCAL